MPLHLSLLEGLLVRLNLVPVPLMDTPLAPGEARALITACELGVFDALAERPRSLNELAERLDCQPRGLYFLLNLLSLGGYLSQRGGRYRNRAVARRWLTCNSPLNVAPYILHSPDLLSIWEHLPEVIRTGHAPVHMPYEDDRSQPEVRAALERHYAGLASLARILGRDLVWRARLSANARRLLDVGGSHAIYSILFCQRYPDLRATIVDLEAGLEAGRCNTCQAGLSERVDFVSMDFVRQPFPAEFAGEFDAACYLHIAHLLSPEANEQLLQRVIACLCPGGQLIFVDQLTDQRVLSRLSSALVQLMALTVSAIGGTCYPFATIQGWLEKAGCTHIRRHTLFTPGATLITARKG